MCLVKKSFCWILTTNNYFLILLIKKIEKKKKNITTTTPKIFFFSFFFCICKISAIGMLAKSLTQKPSIFAKHSYQNKLNFSFFFFSSTTDQHKSFANIAFFIPLMSVRVSPMDININISFLYGSVFQVSQWRRSSVARSASLLDFLSMKFGTR